VKKRILCAALCALLLAPTALAVPEHKAPSAILMEASTGKILYEQDAHKKLPPASVTKIMTLLLTMEALENGRISWDDKVTASAAAAGKGGSQIYLEEGESLSMDEMLKSVAVSSANDCATALAEHIAGSESAFVTMMNARAQELGMENTHFVNCTGLDDDPDAAEHLTTAHDIALMSRELLKHDAIRKYTTIWMDTVRDGAFGLTNTNKLVRFYDGATGLKTGYTSSAGHCLSASARRDGMELIAVVLHCSSSVDRFESAKALLNHGFANYCLVPVQPEQPLQPLPVDMGAEKTVLPVPEGTPSVLLEKSLQKNAKVTVTLPETVTAPVEKGQRLGTLTVEAGGDTVAEYPLVAAQAVPRLRWGQVLRRLLRSLCMG